MFIDDFALLSSSHNKCFRKNKNKHFIFKNIFEKVPLWDNMLKYDISREVTDNNVILGQVIEQRQQNM
jgi:hypothetical protein